MTLQQYKHVAVLYNDIYTRGTCTVLYIDIYTTGTCTVPYNDIDSTGTNMYQYYIMTFIQQEHVPVQ